MIKKTDITNPFLCSDINRFHYHYFIHDRSVLESTWLCQKSAQLTYFQYEIASPGQPSISNEDKLAFYALFKQATTGENNTKAPSRLKVV
jgi:hypothetical protein